MFQNFKKLFSSQSRIIAYILLVALAWGVWWYFTDVAIMFGNYGKLHTYTDITLSMIMIFGFPLFVIALYHKGSLFGKREHMNPQTGVGILSGAIGTIISGASCCGLTLASYFGLLPLMNFLPYDGLEIKIIGTLWLLWALSDILRNLETCSVKK